MITIVTATKFTVSKANDRHWDFSLQNRSYAIETGFARLVTDFTGLRAVLAVSLDRLPGVTEDVFNELDSTINDMLRLWNEGQVALIDARQVPFQYALKVDGQNRVDLTRYYTDVTGVMNELEGERLKRLEQP